MLALALIVLAAASAWMIRKIVKTDQALLDQRAQREMDFLARNMPARQAPPQVSSHPPVSG